MDYIQNTEGKLTPHFTIRELANAWNVCTRTINRMISRGEIGVIKIGRNIRIPSSEIKRWMEQQVTLMNSKVRDVNNLINYNV